MAGKGGAGKTTISATLARIAARRGMAVVAIDADSNPNLATALGADPAAPAPAMALPSSLVSRRLGGPALTVSLSHLLDQHGAFGLDGVRLVMMGAPGHAGEGCLCSAHATVSALLADLADQPETLAVVDFEASPEHLSRGTARYADTLLLIAEPYYRSLEATRRIATLAAELPIPRVAVVANKIRSAADAEAVGQFCDRHGLERIAEVPWSDEVVDADRATIPLLDAAPDGQVVAAISELASQVMYRSPAPAAGA